MPQPGFLWAPLQQSVSVVGGGALKKDGRLVLWGLHTVCICCMFQPGPGRVGEVAGRLIWVLPVETRLSAMAAPVVADVA